jgi:hypothetical protein
MAGLAPAFRFGWNKLLSATFFRWPTPAAPRTILIIPLACSTDILQSDAIRFASVRLGVSGYFLQSFSASSRAGVFFRIWLLLGIIAAQANHLRLIWHVLPISANHMNLAAIDFLLSASPAAHFRSNHSPDFAAMDAWGHGETKSNE